MKLISWNVNGLRAVLKKKTLRKPSRRWMPIGFAFKKLRCKPAKRSSTCRGITSTLTTPSARAIPARRFSPSTNPKMSPMASECPNSTMKAA